MPSRSLVIKVTAGTEDLERCGQALTVAATATASGVPVSLWLAGEAVWLAVAGRAEEHTLPHSPPLSELLAHVLAEGTVTVCTQCAARRGLGQPDLLDRVRISGAPTFVAEVTADGVQALVY